MRKSWYILDMYSTPFFANLVIVRWKDLSFRSVIKDYGRFFIRRFLFLYLALTLTNSCVCASRSWLRFPRDGCLLVKYPEMVRSNLLSCIDTSIYVDSSERNEEETGKRSDGTRA